MIEDGRSNKVICLAHCMLNSNAICVGPKTPGIYPAMIDEVVDYLKENKIGIIQLPCPEQSYFGFVKGYDTKSEMDTPEFRKYCRKIVKEVTDLVEGYLKNDFKVLGFVGKRASPTCGVRKIWIRENDEMKEVEGKGILVEELQEELKSREIKIPFIDFERTEVEECIKELGNLSKG